MKEEIKENKDFKEVKKDPVDLNEKNNSSRKEENLEEENSKNKNIQNNDKTKEEKEKKSFFSNNKVKKLEKEIELLKEKLEEEKLDKLRVLAEFENYRKRMQKTLEESKERAIINFIEDLLPVIDNFELSLKMTDNKDMFIKGVEMIHKNLIETLKNYNFESFEPKEMEEFDPYLHDPIPIEKHEAPEGKIIGIIKKGYKHKDKVIRPAKVHVKKLKEETSNN
jgi:molecular chaperone GrpE